MAVGKSLGGATVAMIQTVIMVVLAPFVGISLTVMVVVKLLLLAFLMSFAITSLGVMIAARMDSMQGFQMIMNFLVMPLYFLSGGMFPVGTAPGWMKTLMTIDPLTYGVDALRSIVFSGTTVTVGTVSKSLVEVARMGGLIRWDLAFDVGIMALVAVVLGGAAAVSFSTANQ